MKIWTVTQLGSDNSGEAWIHSLRTYRTLQTAQQAVVSQAWDKVVNSDYDDDYRNENGEEVGTLSDYLYEPSVSLEDRAEEAMHYLDQVSISESEVSS